MLPLTGIRVDGWTCRYLTWLCTVFRERGLHEILTDNLAIRVAISHQHQSSCRIVHPPIYPSTYVRAITYVPNSRHVQDDFCIHLQNCGCFCLFSFLTGLLELLLLLRSSPIASGMRTLRPTSQPVARLAFETLLHLTHEGDPCTAFDQRSQKGGRGIERFPGNGSQTWVRVVLE